MLRDKDEAILEQYRAKGYAEVEVEVEDDGEEDGKDNGFVGVSRL